MASPGKNVASRPHRPGTYRKVLDQRKRPIRGLWRCNGRYYAQLTVEDPNPGVRAGVKTTEALNEVAAMSTSIGTSWRS